MTDTKALDLLMRLMAIPGSSGDERLVAEFITSELCSAGAEARALVADKVHHRAALDGQQGNLILKLRGTRRGPRRMLSAHMDTVPICVGSRPTKRNGSVYSANRATGLGADDRAGCAVLLSTAISIIRNGLPHPPLTFVWTVQEEVGLLGARHVRMDLLGKPKLGFNFDGGSPSKLTIGATGGYRMEIEILGIASHAGAAPQKGVSAIAIASLAVADLVQSGWHGQITKGRRVGTSNVGVIHGGAATNVVTECVTIRAEARSHDAKFRERIVDEIRKAFGQAAKRVQNHENRCGEIRVRGRLDYDSFRLKQNEPCVIAATKAIRSDGLDLQLAIANGGLDANWFSARGIPTASLGCGQRNIHTAGEQLDIAEFQAARRIALRLATATESG